MRLPHDLVQRTMFQFDTVDDLLAAVGPSLGATDVDKILQLVKRGLPPIVSEDVLAAMIGLNPGVIWSFTTRPNRHYRTFTIPKGRSERTIVAPKIGLKIIQSWLAYHFSRAYIAPSHVFGFVGGRSHVDAAQAHVGAEWAYSVDIEDFFPSISQQSVQSVLMALGYDGKSASLIGKLCCLNGALPQGAPTSPALSNFCFAELDMRLLEIADNIHCAVTRFADDIVFSGLGEMPSDLRSRVRDLFKGTPFSLAAHKEIVQPLKGRIKIHGLLVKNDGVRLTKGYRNKLRAYAHMINKIDNNSRDYDIIRGHLNYGNFVTSRRYNDEMIYSNMTYLKDIEAIRKLISIDGVRNSDAVERVSTHAKGLNFLDRIAQFFK